MSFSFIAKIMSDIGAVGQRGRAARALARFVRDEAGVALVEFAVVLPMMLLVFAVIIEGSRTMLSYQSAINGVRDATRYLARTVNSDVCTTSASVTSYATQLRTLVVQGVTAKSVFPPSVTIGAVTPSYRCVIRTYRGGTVAVAQVTAVITVTFPFSGLFSLVGISRPVLVTSVTDQARVYGS